MLGMASKTLMLSEWTDGFCCGAFLVGCGLRHVQKLYFGSGAGAGLYFWGFFCVFSPPFLLPTTPVVTPVVVKALDRTDWTVLDLIGPFQVWREAP